MSNRKYIIFGSAGFVGKQFIFYIRKNKLGEIITFDIKDNVEQDVRKKINLKGVFSNEDVIINLAAIHKTPGHPDSEYFETNMLGAENVSNFAEENGINNIIFTSSIAPYGAAEEEKFENTLATPNTPYGISKLVAEKTHQIWQSKDLLKRKLLIIRPGVIFGNGEGGNFTRLYYAIKKGVFFYPGRRDTRKACIYVKDLVYASLELLKGDEMKSEVYNFCYSEPPRIDYIAMVIADVISCKAPRLKISGKLLLLAAAIIGALGGRKFGIHPDRVRKLMISTNISGQKLSNVIQFPFGLEQGIKDWFLECDSKGLF